MCLLILSMTIRTGLKGRGNKPKTVRTLAADKIRDKIAQALADNIDEILKAQIDAAKGISIQTTEAPNGVTTVYGKPDIQAAKGLIEQAIGRPKETIEHKGNLGIVGIINQLEGDDD